MTRNWWSRQIQRWLSGSRGPKRSRAASRPTFRPVLEQLETRLVPSVNTVNVNSTADSTNFTAATVTIAQVTAPGATVSLLDAINAANNDAVTNPSDSTTINLAANATYLLNQTNNYWYGPDGLPPIYSDITIHGFGATIERAVSAPAFRLFYVSGGLELPPGSLAMDNVTLSGGLAKGGDSFAGGGGLGAGGAIFNQGELTLTAVTLTNNEAEGGSSSVSSAGIGGGGMGGAAPTSGNGGSFGGSLGGSFGGAGGQGTTGFGGGGGGFVKGANGMTNFNGGGLGGFANSTFVGVTGDGGDGGGSLGSGIGGVGGDFGTGSGAASLDFHERVLPL